GKPLSDGQLWRYIRRADQMIAESCRASRRKLLRRHLAQRRNLYAKAVSAGDYRTALAVVRDEAELQGLYADLRVKVGGDKESPPKVDAGVRVTMEDRLQLITRLRDGLSDMPEARRRIGRLLGLEASDADAANCAPGGGPGAS